MVCILADPAPSTDAKIPRFPTSSPPATDQNFTCLTPTLTNCVSESGRNSARKILCEWPGAEAILVPVRERIQIEFHRKQE